MIRATAICCTVLMLLAGCAQSPPTNGSGVPAGDQPFVTTGDQKADWDRILALEEEAKRLVKTDGCSAADGCRTAPVGSRACGGPRYYVIYCAATTDSAALFRKLDEVAAAERAFNTRYQIASTCEFRMPPDVGIANGVCGSR